MATQEQDKLEDYLFAEKLRLLYEGIPVAVLGNLVVGTLFFYTMSGAYVDGRLELWFAGLVAVSIYRTAVLAAYHYNRFVVEQNRIWFALFFAGIAGSAIVWTGAPLFLFPQDDVVHQAFIGFYVAGMSASGLTSLSFLRSTALVYMLPMLLVLAARFALEGDAMHLAMMASTLMFALVLLFSALRIYRTTHESVRLRYEIEQIGERLDEDEARYRTLIETAADTFLLHDMSGRILDANAEACRSLGYTRHELLRRSVSDIETRLRKAGERSIWHNLRPGRPVTLRGEQRRRDGSTFPVEVRLGLFMQGEERLVSVLARDISERERVARALAESERRFRSVVEYSPMGLFVYKYDDERSQLIFVDYNAAAERILGTRCDRYVGLSLEEAFPPLANTEIPARYTRAALEGVPWHTDQVSYDHGEISGAYEVYVFRFAPMTIAVLFLDIADRMRAEAALRKSEEGLAKAQHIAKIGSWMWDMRSGKMEWSDEIYRILGYDRGEIAPSVEYYLAVMHKDDLAKAEQAQTLAAEGRYHHFDEQWRIVDATTGEIKYTHFIGELLVDEAGAPEKMVGTLQDISERMAAERARNEFIAIVSHELRTPLTSVRGTLGLLNGGAAGKLTATAQDLVAAALRNAERLSRLINDMLDIAKVESGQMDYRFESVPVRDFLEGVISTYIPFAAEKRVILVMGGEIVPTLRMRADPDRVAQVLGNLISNAVKYSIEGGCVTIQAKSGDEQIRFSVADRGAGLPENVGDKIFNKFARAEGASRVDSGGVGLGLYISRLIVEDHGGSISYRLRKSGGAEFYFTLPLAGANGADTSGA